MRRAFIATLLLALPLSAQAAEPMRIGITAPMTGPYPDRPLAERRGIETALVDINQHGGVLKHELGAVFLDNACKPELGAANVDALVQQEHVAVIIGALCTPATRGAMPEAAAQKVPFVIDITAGQDFVDPAGVGGNRYAFKINPSEVDLARGYIAAIKKQGARRIALLADPNAFAQSNATAMRAAASAAGMTLAADETIPAQGFDAAALLARLRAAKVDHVVVGMMGKSVQELYRALEQADWAVPVGGRYDLGAALGAVAPGFAATRGHDATIAGYSALLDTPENRHFVAGFKSVSGGAAPDQRAFYGWVAARLVADAIRRAGKAEPEAIRAALAKSTMRSPLGGDFRMDAHNHAHPGALLLGTRGGKVVVVGKIAT